MKARDFKVIYDALFDPNGRAYIIAELRKQGENDLADQIEELNQFD